MLATSDEVLELLTDIIHGSIGEEIPRIAERLKAAELLVRYCGMFADDDAAGSEEQRRQAAEDVEEMVREGTSQGRKPPLF